MTDFPLSRAEIVAWYNTKKQSLARTSVVAGSLYENERYLPSASMDFEGPTRMGRISG